MALAGLIRRRTAESNPFLAVLKKSSLCSGGAMYSLHFVGPVEKLNNIQGRSTIPVLLMGYLANFGGFNVLLELLYIFAKVFHSVEFLKGCRLEQDTVP